MPKIKRDAKDYNDLISDSLLHDMGEPVELFPGIVGHSLRRRKTITILFVISSSEGKGNMSRYLEHLKENYDIIRFPNMISGKLTEMLKRRGFLEVLEWDAAYNAEVDVLIWRKNGEGSKTEKNGENGRS